MRGGFSVFVELVEELNGTIEFVLGNHDGTVVPNLDGVHVHEEYRFTHRSIPFYCVHEPENAPRNWDGWVLHGHHHNNWPDRFPFVNPERRRVNVSVELIEYEPLAVPRLVEIIRQFETIPDISHAE